MKDAMFSKGEGARRCGWGSAARGWDARDWEWESWPFAAAVGLSRGGAFERDTRGRSRLEGGCRVGSRVRRATYRFWNSSMCSFCGMATYCLSVPGHSKAKLRKIRPTICDSQLLIPEEVRRRERLCLDAWKRGRQRVRRLF
jgi:hypothetical protein